MDKSIWLILLMCLFAGMCQNRHTIIGWIDPPPPRAPHTERVVMYATKRCPYCTKMRNFLEENSIAYQEMDVDASEAANAEFEELGGNGVPLIVIDETKVIMGYDPESVIRALQ